uniref:ATP synthase CFO B chain subunit I n=1 Tax=Apophlaea sinclairii TaxID=212746 RepID=A0A1C9CBI9_9FLOR|nr:ATP synthase CFO B chain subunit I [Apophlaea sinclairii]AOM65735.1 ATP synthase CFO B chain subunit I [Apophlaea sinclairii]
MQIITLIQVIVSEHNTNYKWSFNSNLLETNVINILLLLGSFIYVLQKFLSKALYNRQVKVLATVEEAEDQLKQAKNRLLESQKQLHHSQNIIDQIQQEAIITAQKVRQSIINQGKLDVDRLAIAAKSSIEITESQIRKQIQEQITTLAIKRVFAKLKEEINSDEQTNLIDKSISQLEIQGEL